MIYYNLDYIIFEFEIVTNNIDFKNRFEEVQEILSLINSNNFEMIVVYGRRIEVKVDKGRCT